MVLRGQLHPSDALDLSAELSRLLSGGARHLVVDVRDLEDHDDLVTCVRDGLSDVVASLDGSLTLLTSPTIQLPEAATDRERPTVSHWFG